MTELKQLTDRLLEKYGLLTRPEWEAQLPELLKTIGEEKKNDVATVIRNALFNERLLCDIAGQLTNDESFFFRHPQHMEALLAHTEQALGQKKFVTIISAGCAAGQEPYSVAMSLHRRFTDVQIRRVRIVGVDLNRNAIERCLAAVYPRWSFRSTSEEDIQRFFTLLPDNMFQLRDVIREMVSFYHMPIQHLLQAVPLATADVILFRNVSIYLHSAALHKITELFTRLLAPSGLLFTAPSDPPLPIKGTSLSNCSNLECYQLENAASHPIAPVDGAMSRYHGSGDRKAIADASTSPLPVAIAHRCQETLGRTPETTGTSAQNDVSFQLALDMIATGQKDQCEPLLEHSQIDTSFLYGLAHFLEEEYQKAADCFRESYFETRENLITLFWYAYSLQQSAEPKRAQMQWNALKKALQDVPEGTLLEDGYTTSDTLLQHINRIAGV
ncbi:MAG: hypothetical protein JXR76_06155 [Deltaproteobacteria bacterium]|nr:hypothetical protein [Deltaproteobacteria bacterium]